MLYDVGRPVAYWLLKRQKIRLCTAQVKNKFWFFKSKKEVKNEKERQIFNLWFINVYSIFCLCLNGHIRLPYFIPMFIFIYIPMYHGILFKKQVKRGITMENPNTGVTFIQLLLTVLIGFEILWYALRP